MWLRIDQHGLVLNIGFLSFSVLKLIDAIKAGHYKQVNLDTLSLVFPVIIIVLAAGNLFSEERYPTELAVVGIRHRVIGRRVGVGKKGSDRK